MEKCVELWLQITTMVVIFNLQNPHLLTLSLPTKEVFQVNGQNRPVANLPVVDFLSQPREMLTPKPLNTKLSASFWIMVFSPWRSRSLNLTVCQRYGFLSAIFRESSDKLHVLRIVKALPFIHQPESQKSLYNNAVYVIKSFLNSDEAITFTYFSQVITLQALQ